jgi:hypothetical protein
LVLFLWAALGWLLPTLLLLPAATDRVAEQGQWGQHGASPPLILKWLDSLGGLVESILGTLLPPKHMRMVDRGGPQGDSVYAMFTFCLYWVGVLLFLWWGVCALAGPVKPAEQPGFWVKLQGAARGGDVL